MEDNTPKPRAYVNVGIGPTFRDLAMRMAQLKNALEGTKLSLRAYLEGLIQADAAGNFDAASAPKNEVSFLPSDLQMEALKVAAASVKNWRPITLLKNEPNAE